MPRFVLLLVSVLTLSGCAGVLTGTVSTATYSDPSTKHSFTVITPDNLSLTDRNLSAHIEKKMLERGYVKAELPKTANVAVIYKYSVGSGRTEVSSSPDFVWGGKQVETSTTYPRFFQIVIVDIEKSKLPEKVEIIWQGEIRSSGSSENISRLGPYFIDALFENYGGNVTNKRFFKTIEW